MKKIGLLGFALVLLLHFSACDEGGDDTLVHIHKDEFTLEDQHKIGTEVQTYIEENPQLFPVLDRDRYPAIYAYLDNLMEILTTTTLITTREDFEWEVTIIKDDLVRSAFTAPGGKIFIYTGLLKFIKAENELISILAHEIAYIESQKVMEHLAAEYSKNLVFLGDILLGYEVDGMDELCLRLKDLQYSKEEVMEADDFAIDLICPFQYNALGIKSIIDQATLSGIELRWLVVRPSAANRVAKIIEKAEVCGDEEDPTFEERYQSYKEQLP